MESIPPLPEHTCSVSTSASHSKNSKQKYKRLSVSYCTPPEIAGRVWEALQLNGN